MRIPPYYQRIEENKTKYNAINSKTTNGYKHEKPR